METTRQNPKANSFIHTQTRTHALSHSLFTNYSFTHSSAVQHRNPCPYRMAFLHQIPAFCTLSFSSCNSIGRKHSTKYRTRQMPAMSPLESLSEYHPQPLSRSTCWMVMLLAMMMMIHCTCSWPSCTDSRIHIRSVQSNTFQYDSRVDIRYLRSDSLLLHTWQRTHNHLCYPMIHRVHNSSPQYPWRPRYSSYMRYPLNLFVLKLPSSHRVCTRNLGKDPMNPMPYFQQQCDDIDGLLQCPSSR